jgi:hypothetical protein
MARQVVPFIVLVVREVAVLRFEWCFEPGAVD